VLAVHHRSGNVHDSNGAKNFILLNEARLMNKQIAAEVGLAASHFTLEVRKSRSPKITVIF